MSELTDKERKERDDVLWVMSTEQGRRFMWRMLGETRMFHDIEGDKMAHVAKQIGRRQVGLFLTGIIMDASEDSYFKMQMEAKNKTFQEINDVNSRQPTDADTFESFHSGDAYASIGDDYPEFIDIDRTLSARYT